MKHDKRLSGQQNVDRLTQSDRPIGDYDQALWRCLVHFAKEGIDVPATGELPFAAELVGEIFWVNRDRVRRDLRKKMREILWT